jgi:Putative transposase/Transposase zinc-binding domain
VKAGPTLGQILRGVVAGGEGLELRLSPEQWKVVRALAACRTAALGGGVYYCPACRREHFVAHSCRNRHCPQCQGAAAREWLEREQEALLPIPYFHLVFTLPHELNGVVRQNRRAVLNLLFGAASQTLLAFGRTRLKAQLGITAVLHTWSQNLLDHYHVHCIVSGGGLALQGGGWVRTADHYLFPVRALSGMYRGKFLAGLEQLYEAGELEFHGQEQVLEGAEQFGRLLKGSARKKWVVYAKRPFAGPETVLKYLSRYTHRVALSNGRLLSADGQSVSFRYKDYAAGAVRRTMRLELGEFVRRFCLHVLPERFVKIRHYGLLGNRGRQQRLERARRLLGVGPAQEDKPAEVPSEPEGRSATEGAVRCPYCGRVGQVRVRDVACGQEARSAVALLDST